MYVKALLGVRGLCMRFEEFVVYIRAYLVLRGV